MRIGLDWLIKESRPILFYFFEREGELETILVNLVIMINAHAHTMAIQSIDHPSSIVLGWDLYL